MSFSNLLFIFTLLLLILYVFYYHWNRRRLYKIAAKYPGPSPIPIFGNAFILAFCHHDELLAKTVELFRSYPSPMRFWLGPQLILVFSEPPELEAILTSPKCATKGQLYRFLEPLLGKGLISGSGPMWKFHRKIITPTLNSKLLERFMPILNEQASVLMECLQEHANGKAFNIIDPLELCAMDMISETIMNTKVEAQTSEYGHGVFLYLAHCYESVFSRMAKIWMHPDIIYKYTKQCHMQNAAMKELHTFILNAVDKIKQDYANDIIEDKKMLTTVERLIQYDEEEGNTKTKEMVDELLTMFVAGQDTTAIESAFSVLMLAMHPEIQDKVYEEIKNVFGTSSRPIQWADYPRLEYLEMVIKETVRLFPIAPIMIRSAEEELLIGKHVVPAGTEILISAFVAHRSPSHWRDPEMFIPERFLPEESAKRHPFAYIPFSYGARSCVGQKFAMIALKTIVTYIIRLYKIETDFKYEDLDLKSDISIRSKKGYPVRLVLR